MKKILLLFTALLFSFSFATAQQEVGQQFANNHFEQWRNETSSRVAPVSWNSLNSGSGNLQSTAAKDFIAKSTDTHPNASGQYSVQLQCVGIWIVITTIPANGGITTGRFNAGSTTASDPMNCTYTSSESGFNHPLTSYPDSVYVWTKTSISKSSHKARFNIVIHKYVPGVTAMYQDPAPDGGGVVNTSTTANTQKEVATATLNFNTSGQWVQQKVAFNYNDYGNEPAYVLATFSTNQTAGTGTSGDKLLFDDIVLIYNTRLASLKANNVAISGFNPDITTYTYPLCEGADFPTITFSCQSAHANATITHAATTSEPYTTIRVTHLNQESTVYKDYTINYEITNPTIPIVENNINKCYGNPIEITAIIPEGCTGYWSTGDPTVPERTGSSYLYTGNENTTINVLSHHNVAGCNSGVASVNVNVYPQIDTPVPGETTSICPGSTATFSAALPTGENLQLRWYETATSTTVLGTDNVLEIDNLTATTTRYASTYNPATGCESDRVAVTVYVNDLPAAPTAAATTSVCYGATGTFSATLPTGDNLMCHWYETATSTTVLDTNNVLEIANLTANTTKYVSTYSSATTCESERVAVTVNVNALPAAPSVNNTAICGAGEATLSVQAVSGESYLWFENATGGESIHNGNSWTGDITENTTLYVEAVSAEGCHSSSRTAATATVKSVPTAPSASDASHCGTGNLTLSVNDAQDGYTYNWYLINELVNTGINYTIEDLSVTTTYNVTATLDGCESEASSVTATINAIPAAPVVYSDSVCGSGEVTLNVQTISGNSYLWFENATGGESIHNGDSWTGDITENTTLYVEAVSAESCHSATRTAVTAKVNAIPVAPLAQNLNLCGSGKAVMTAIPAENCICQWFNSNNEPITTGVSDDSKTLTVNTVSSSTIYYVRSYNETTQCHSENATVEVIVATIPGRPTMAGSFARCGAGELTLSAIPGNDANSLRWFNSNGTQLGEGLEYTTESLSENTDFTVKSYNSENGCVSTSSLSVTATINAVPAIPEVSGNTTLCTGQSTSLTATSDAQATSFQWFKNEELVCENATFITPALNESTTYRVKAINSTTLCESAVSNVVITVNANPIAPVAYADTACKGETIILISEAAAGHTCYWYADETSTTVIATGNSFSSTELSVGETTFYVNQKNNETGCQSTRTAVNAMVYPTYAVDYPVTACDSFVWNNETFKSSGNYERTLSSINSCDSVVTLQLTINHSYDITIDTTVCDLFVWNDQEYRESDVLTHLYTSAQQCDSLVTINLTVLKSTVGEDHIYLCSNELPYNYNDLYTVTAAGIFDVHTTNAAGCDSTIHLTVTVNNQPALATNLTSGARCGEGSVRLSATFGTNGTTCRWYASETSEEVLFEGGSFNTPSIAETSTYYVSSYNNYNGHPCESGRQAVIATVNANPTAPVVENQVRCGDGEISFTAQIDESATTCRWYLTNTATTPSATGLEFSTNIFVNNGETFFYVESYNANTTCKSEKQAVTATAYPIPAAPVLAGQSNCGPARFHINAPATGFYKWYDNAESTVALDITDNTTPLISASRNYYISQNINYSNIICESKKSVLALTIYPVYEPQVIFDTLCQGDTYTQHGIRETFDEAGSFDRIINTISSNGCDSLVTLRLWVKEIRNSEFSATECVSYTWNDETFTQSGDFVRHFTSSIGCDSVVTLHLTINPVYNKTVDMTICESALPFTWNDKTFPIGTPSGNYEHTYFGHAQTGCDSTVKLQLTISNQYVTNLNKDICEGESYNFGERVLTESGIYYDTLLAHNLCDSIIILKLNVHELHTTLLNDEICLGETYVNYGFNITPMEAGSHDYEKVVKTSFGCDSTVKLTLVVHPSYIFEPETASICDNEEYVWTGHEHIVIGQRTAGTYIIWDSLTTANGCDSVYKLTLTVNPSFYNESTATTCDNINYVWTGHEHIQIGQLDAGTYTFWDSLMTTNQCDSVYKLTLTVNQTKHTDLYASICHGEVYTYNNKNYSTAGDYDHNFETTLGCDSIVTLHLTVNPKFDIDTTVSICEGALPYTFADTIFYQGGSKDVFLHTQFGCDSIYHVTLQVNPFLTKSVSDEICDNELPYHYLDSTFYRSGVYEITETHDDGCNEITTLTLTVNPTYEQDDYATACGSYTLVRPTYSRIITQSGIYTDTLSTVKGCDSIVHLHLTIYPTYYYEEEGTTCDNETYVWEGHEHIQIGVREEGTYTFWDSLKTINSCDSVYELTLTVHPSYDVTFDTTVCDLFVWNEEEYTESGIFTQNFTTINNCDSVVSVHLTVNHSYDISIDTTVCDLFVWNNQEYTESDVLTHLYTSAQQCDSLVTINLTVNHSVEQNETLTICQSQLPYPWRDTTFEVGTVSGEYTFVRETAQHCDSVVILNLTVNPNNEFFDDPVIMCQGETFTWNGQVITESGLYTDTVDNQYGCYDVYKLLVTVHPTYDFYEYDTVCQNELPIEWRGRSFNAAASYDFVYPTINNCDSTYHFTLTVNPSYLYEENDDVCANETYVWEGHEYIQIEQMAVGTHTIWDSLTTVNGCDSVYKLTLNVHPSYYFEESDETCDNENYVWEGHAIQIGQRETGTYIIWDSLTTANGCDSVYKLTLTVHQSYFEENEAVTCDNEIFVWEGHETVEIGQRSAGTHIIWDSLITVNGCDSVFMLMLTVNPTAHSIENASACSNEDSYIWHGRTITETGIYFDTLATMLACDSVCELRFTLLEPTSATFVDTTCANSTYTAYGFNIENLPAGDTTLLRVTKNSVGCDSTITVLLNVKPIFETSFDTINCGALLWNNTWYQESGQYQQVFEAANGCDSIVTMNLIVDTPSRDTAYVTACDFYEWDGTIYNQSGTYSKIYPQPVGCDSIAVLLLTINHSQEVTFYDTTCLGEIYQGYGFDTLITQVGNIQIQRVDNTVAGCDSTINVMLRVYASYLIIDSVSTCDNEPYTWQGSSYNESGTYTVSYTSVHGCDSTHVLVLEVYPTYNVDIEDTAVVGVPYHKYGLNFTPQNVGTLHIPVPNITVMGCDSILNITLEVVDGSSIEQYRLANTISLYPNPTENVFTVNSSLDAIKELTIFDNNGKAVLYQSINGNNGSVNVEALAPGIYFVQLETEHGIVHKKLIVR